MAALSLRVLSTMLIFLIIVTLPRSSPTCALLLLIVVIAVSPPPCFLLFSLPCIHLAFHRAMTPRSFWRRRFLRTRRRAFSRESGLFLHGLPQPFAVTRASTSPVPLLCSAWRLALSRFPPSDGSTAASRRVTDAALTLTCSLPLPLTLPWSLSRGDWTFLLLVLILFLFRVLAYRSVI